MHIVEVVGLHKRFNKKSAIKNLNLSIEKRELFGLIGPDGAGKTTLLRLLAGVLTPDQGTIECCAVDVVANPEAVKKKIGVVPQEFSLYHDLTVEENLNFFAKMYGVGDEESTRRKEKLLQIMSLKPFRKRRAENLSGGMQKKLALICSLLHTPPLLLLDEPTTGIDPISRRELWDFFYELIDDGATIIISTPYMDEAERCSKVGFLYEGELLLFDDPLRIKERYPYHIFELRGPDILKMKTDIFPEQLQILDLYPVRDTLHLITKDPVGKKLQQFFKEKTWKVQVKRIGTNFEDVFVSVIKREYEDH